MIRRLFEKLLLRPEDLTPRRDDFAVIGVFNPGVITATDDVILIARVAEWPSERRRGFVGLPRYAPDGDIVVDWASEDTFEEVDAGVVRRRSDNFLRLTSISHLRVFRSRDGLSEFLPSGPLLLPESQMEEFGIEDPRITKIEGKYWITYVAVSRYGVATALASTEDFVTFERHGVIFSPENKDVVLFPRKLDGQYLSLHRPTPSSQFSRPQIWLAHSPNLLHWGGHECVFSGIADWESDRIGAGAPPIEMEEGWLEIYHGSQQASRAAEVGAYSAGALLLDRTNPAHVLRRSHEPIMQPTTDFERTGFVGNVVFPTALVDLGDTLRVYYGASDTYIGVTEFSRKELMAALQ